MRVPVSLGHRILQLLLGTRSSSKHEIMQKWGILNVSVLLNEHGQPPFLFQSCSSHIIDIQLTKFERKSIVGLMAEELP